MDLSGLQHAEIPACAACFLHKPCNIRPVKAQIEPPAGLPPLADLQQHIAIAPEIAKADIRLGRIRDDEILAKTAGVKEAGPIGQIGGPISVMRGRIGVDGLVRPAMMPAVALLVTDQPVCLSPDRAGNGMFVDAAWNGLRPKRLYLARPDFGDCEDLHRATFRGWISHKAHGDARADSGSRGSAGRSVGGRTAILSGRLAG